MGFMNEYRKNEDDASCAIMTQEEPRSFAPLFSRKTMPAQQTVEGAPSSIRLSKRGNMITEYISG